MFKRIKRPLQLEHTSGLSWHAARPDFGAKAVFDNLNALAAYVATNARLDPGSSYKINRTLAIDKIKRQIDRWLLAATATSRRLKPILEEIALNLQKFVPDRSQPRKPQPKPYLSHAHKWQSREANFRGLKTRPQAFARPAGASYEGQQSAADLPQQ